VRSAKCEGNLWCDPVRISHFALLFIDQRARRRDRAFALTAGHHGDRLPPEPLFGSVLAQRFLVRFQISASFQRAHASVAEMESLIGDLPYGEGDYLVIHRGILDR